MTGAPTAAPTAAQLRAIEDTLDRVDLRLRDSERGIHGPGPAAAEDQLEIARALGMPEAALVVWKRFNGFEIAHGESRLLPVAEIEAATRAAAEQGLIGPGELVVGSCGLEDLVLPQDPWEEGADVVLVADDGQRAPFGSTVGLTLLALLSRSTVVMDEGGEYRDEVIGEDGELTIKAERKLCRRHLDADADAPYPRFRLGQLLRRSGNARAARKELELTLRRAPSFTWARFELGRAHVDLDEHGRAIAALERAASGADDEGFAGLILGWACLSAARSGDPARQRRLADQARSHYPGIVAAQEAGAREAFEMEEFERSALLIELGLALEPRHLGLLELRRSQAQRPE